MHPGDGRIVNALDLLTPPQRNRLLQAEALQMHQVPERKQDSGARSVHLLVAS